MCDKKLLNGLSDPCLLVFMLSGKVLPFNMGWFSDLFLAKKKKKKVTKVNGDVLYWIHKECGKGVMGCHVLGQVTKWLLLLSWVDSLTCSL